MDKRKEKQLEKMKSTQMSPEEMKEQRVKTKVNLELSIKTKTEEIESLTEMVETKDIKLKDETYVDGIMPLYKLKHILGTAKLQLKDYELMLEELDKLLEEDKISEVEDKKE